MTSELVERIAEAFAALMAYSRAAGVRVILHIDGHPHDLAAIDEVVPVFGLLESNGTQGRDGLSKTAD